MGYESINDKKIKELISMPKRVIDPSARQRQKGQHIEVNYHLQGERDDTFNLYTRQNVNLLDDFSCGISWNMPSGEVLTFTRYNGPSHNHPNQIEKEKLGYNCHIHKANEKYILAGKKPDGFAEVTKKYETLKGALHCLVRDCNISGLDTGPDEPKLF